MSLNAPKFRIAISVAGALVVCICHCAFMAEFSRVAMCSAASATGALKSLDVLSVLLLSVLIYSVLSVFSGQSVAANLR